MMKLIKAEKKIRSKELHQNQSPSSVKTYEKAILVSPNSSFLWIKYAAYAIDTFGIERARELLKKAISTISPTEEREKLNIHLALMNLESAYGTAESFEQATSLALSTNDHGKVLTHKALKLLNTKQLDEAESTFKYLCKKNGKNIEHWENLLKFYMVHKKDEEGFEETIRKAGQALKSSLELSKKIAILHYQNGNEEKGRTLFEGLISEKPKRSDIWTVYISLEEKCNKIEQVRDLYERALSCKLGPKSAKLLAYRYCQYELAHKHKEKANEIANRFNINL